MKYYKGLSRGKEYYFNDKRDHFEAILHSFNGVEITLAEYNAGLKKIDNIAEGASGGYANDFSNSKELMNDLIDKWRDLNTINDPNLDNFKSHYHIDIAQINRGKINVLSPYVDTNLQIIFSTDWKAIDQEHVALKTMEELKIILTKFEDIDEEADFPKEMLRLLNKFLDSQKHHSNQNLGAGANTDTTINPDKIANGGA